MKTMVSDHACRDVIAGRLGAKSQSVQCEAACRAIHRAVNNHFGDSVKLSLDTGNHYYDDKVVDGKYLGYVLEFLVTEVVKQSNKLKKEDSDG